MKYKVGDRVKVVWLEGWQSAFKIGDIVTITKEHPEGAPPHYSVDIGRGEIWWLNDDEIELYEEKKMPKYTTEPIDYTDCHPVIAEHLKRGEAILCRVRDSKDFDWSKDLFIVDAYNNGIGPWQYSGFFKSSTVRTFFRYAEPVPIRRKVLMSAEKAVVKLIENGWKLSGFGDRLFINGYTTIYLNALWTLTGREKTSEMMSYPDYIFEEVED